MANKLSLSRVMLSHYESGKFDYPGHVPDIEIDYCDVLFVWRLRLGFSSREMCKQFNISHTQYLKYERKKVPLEVQKSIESYLQGLK